MLFVRVFDLCLFGFSVSSSSWCLGRAAACDCGTPWTFLLPFYIKARIALHLSLNLKETFSEL